MEKETKKKEKESKKEIQNPDSNEIKVKKESKKRIIVAPGEVVSSDSDSLPGEGTRREGDEIVSMKFGLLEKTEKLVKVIPVSGAYIPRIGNTVIGIIADVLFNGWFVNIRAPFKSFLPVSECFGYIDKNELAEHLSIKDVVVVKIKSVKAKSIDVTMKSKGLRKLEGGMIIRINPTRVPRVIGRAGSMVNTIKDQTGCSIVVGQNGVIWIRGEKVEDEILTKKAIEQIVEKPFTEGLTEKIKTFLIDEKNKIK